MKKTPNSDQVITLSHGNGGKLMRELINFLFLKHNQNPNLDTNADSATLSELEGKILVTTDSYTVNPMDFPDSHIGHLAINGTVNDIAVCGGDPKYFSLNIIAEEGLAIDKLKYYIDGMISSANESGIELITGDTKIVPRQQADSVYFVTTGIGKRDKNFDLGMHKIQTD